MIIGTILVKTTIVILRDPKIRTLVLRKVVIRIIIVKEEN